MTDPRATPAGRLDQTDLVLLKKGFESHFPLARDQDFADILARLDEIARRTPSGTSRA